jgi:hypothetical protein
MYLPETLAQDLLRRIAASLASALSSSSLLLSLSSSSFVAVVIYNPIPGHNMFRQLMIENLKPAGIAGGNGGSSGGG